LGARLWLGAPRPFTFGDLTLHHVRTPKSRHFRNLRRYPEHPKNLGEHVRKKRIDLGMSRPKLARRLGMEVTDSAIEKWEKNVNRPLPIYRKRLVEFLGFDPEAGV
jgi:DNA-binding transcriptional regulator YiaG